MRIWALYFIEGMALEMIDAYLLIMGFDWLISVSIGALGFLTICLGLREVVKEK